MNSEKTKLASSPYSVPYNLEIEMNLLGALLRDNRKFDTLGELLSAEYFYLPLHRQLYEIIARVLRQGQVATPDSLGHITENIQELKERGGSNYLIELAENVVSLIHAREYALMLRDLHNRRVLIEIGQDTTERARKTESAEKLTQSSKSQNKDFLNSPFKASMPEKLSLLIRLCSLPSAISRKRGAEPEISAASPLDFRP